MCYNKIGLSFDVSVTLCRYDCNVGDIPWLLAYIPTDKMVSVMIYVVGRKQAVCLWYTVTLYLVLISFCSGAEFINSLASIWLKLEQLERLRSEDTPAASWLPIPLSHIGSQVKRRQSQSYEFKKKFEFWNGHCTRHTFLSCLIRCANMKWIRWVLLKIQSGHDSVRRRTDGQRDKVIPVYPPINFVEAGGIIKTWTSNYIPIKYEV